MTRRLIFLFCLLAPLLPAQSDAHINPAAHDHPGEVWELLAPMVVEKLDNGMTFLIYPNERAPIFSGVIRFDVGGKDEKPGQTGIAHMFEHMAFKGTSRIGTTDYEAEKKALDRIEQTIYPYDAARLEVERQNLSDDDASAALAPFRRAYEKAQEMAAQYVVKDEFDAIYNREGGSQMNASTSGDATTYYISLPSNRLKLWMTMESDRLIDPVMREFYSERDVVMEERRMRLDSSPVGQLWEAINAAAFVAHPYGYPVIGWEGDIQNLKATEAREFYRTHYTPDRAVGVIVGDVDTTETVRLLREYFGRLPARPSDQYPQRIVQEPPQNGERRVRLDLQATPTILMGWHKPVAPDPADIRAQVLIEVLTGGRSSLWFTEFIKNRRLASDIEAFTGPGDHEPNLFMIYAMPQAGTSLTDLEKAIREAVARLATDLLPQAELDRARKVIRANTVRTLETNLGLAQTLAETALLSGDPYYLERRLRELDAVTAEDLRDFAAQYLVPNNLTVGVIDPAPATAPAATASPDS